MIEELAERFSSLGMVQAVALSGSRTSAINDSSSDWDIYIYSDKRVPPEERGTILRDLFPSVRVDCSPFEEGDEAIGRDGMAYDLMYRSTDWTEWQIDDVWRKHNARIGYTTCFLYNISTSEILSDRDGWLESLKDELHSPYPEKLRENIAERNLGIIDGNGESTFLRQAELAYERDDLVSQNHRLSAIIASYFDAVFAWNRVLHPGEKKLQRYAHLLCQSLPEGFDEDIEATVASIGTEDFIPSLRKMADDLRAFLRK